MPSHTDTAIKISYVASVIQHSTFWLLLIVNFTKWCDWFNLFLFIKIANKLPNEP